MNSEVRINNKNTERCLLTEVMPFETPILFSNWGSYNYSHNIEKSNSKIPVPIKKLYDGVGNNRSIPYKFRIKKDISDFRSLYVIHPKHSKDIVSLYDNFDVKISKLCRQSNYSLRSPYYPAKLFIKKDDDNNSDLKSIEDLNENKVYASSYFVYKRFAHLYKFFDSDIFNFVEKKFRNLKYIDISKFFPSIYTHSITWAIIGKHSAKKLATKDKSLGSFFDSLMQNINYGETNGIVVGPEMSRIFAEIIMQRIDVEVESRLKEKGREFGTNYCCFRFVDDFFVFYNDSCDIDLFMDELSHEMEKYKLYINHGKVQDQKRPFITDISEKKIQLSRFLSDLSKKLNNDSQENKNIRSVKINPHREINSVRSILKGCEDKVHAFSNFYLKSLNKHILIMKSKSSNINVNHIMTYIELTFHWVSMDIRVSSIIKISQIVVDILNIIESENFCTVEEKIIKNKINSEIEMLLESVSVGVGFVEASNLLILMSKVASDHLLPVSTLESILNRFKVYVGTDDSMGSRFSYFEITSILFYIKNHECYSTIKSGLIEMSFKIINALDPFTYAESTYLLMDFVSCPYIDKVHKDDFIRVFLCYFHALQKDGKSSSASEVNQVRNFIDPKDSESKRSWYFNWNDNIDLSTILKKKELMVSY